MTTDVVTPEDFLGFVADPAQRDDPYPFYARLRATAPAYQVPIGIWALSGYDEVSLALRDPRFSNDERNATGYAGPTGEGTAFGRLFWNMMLFRDDPDHKRLRDLVQKAFTRRTIENVRPRIATLIDGLLDPILERGGGDLISEFAYPLPVTVICELLGVPEDARARFSAWASDFALRFEISPLRTPESEAKGDHASAKLIELFDELIERKRVHPQDDLISALAAVEDDGDRLSHDELLATCLLILFAGHETTANLIGNGTYALMRNRDQWDRLVEQPALARTATEELLRYDSPVQFIERIALEDVPVGDQTIPAGAMIGVLLGAANRDPAHFSDPDTLDITRGDAPLVAFGGGVHFCLGAPLARLEAQMAFNALARRAPEMQLDAEPARRQMFVIRGLQELRVRIA
jgi:cytochrome P450